ncbi:hypothetical protein BH23CHL2_BH23CHL2_09940 [soil metagenome]
MWLGLPSDVTNGCVLGVETEVLASLDRRPILVHQGARSFGIWTGERAPVDLMMAAAVEERDSRS